VLLDQDRSCQAQQRGGLGNTPTTSVRRLISLLIRSSGFVDQIWRQSRLGKLANARRSSRASSSMTATFGCDLSSILVTSSNWLRMCSRSGWAKTVQQTRV
jgi:hypothetical protein